MTASSLRLGWSGIVRLGLVQAALGGIVVLTTSTLNRVMVVEHALPAVLPGLLVALHYAVQIARPRMGHGSDQGSARTPWIIGGMAVLALGGVGAAAATAWMGTQPLAGLALAVLAFTLVGLGVSACGTSLLVLLAKCVDESRRASAAATVWVMMIMGFVITAGLAGKLLDPYSPQRLILVSAGVSAVALIVTILAVAGIERHGAARPDNEVSTTPFRAALREVWAEPNARLFTVFVFVAMLAYSAQDLILEPFAGAAFGFTVGESTQLSGVQHAGALAGMLLATLAGRRVAGANLGSLRAWTVGGCLASALALLGLVAGAAVAPAWPLRANVFLLGVANGTFSIAAIASMMSLAGAGARNREGVRMGLWGAAQAIAFAVGGVSGAAASDVARAVLGSQGLGYGTVFLAEAGLFVVSAWLAHRVSRVRATHDAANAHEGPRGVLAATAAGRTP